MLLAGDIGGTKTNLAIYSSQGSPRNPLVEATFPSGKYPNLESLVGEFLEKTNLLVERASFGVAGPVVGCQATITNLPWVIEERQLEEKLKLKSVRLLNDLAAIAHAVPILGAGDLYTLNGGVPIAQGTLAVIAPGTGLGEAYLTWHKSRYQAYASEGGHADFAPVTPLQLEMLRYLQERFDHVSYERVCSGKGIPNIYQFLKDTGYAVEPDWLTEQLSAADDLTPVIVNAALDEEKKCQLCTETLNIFVSILGAEAGNMALRLMATGGVYLGGGIPPRILSALDQPDFMQTFTQKGRFSELLSRIPVHVIRNPKVALLGAACHGLEPSTE
jgi:glucokinase